MIGKIFRKIFFLDKKVENIMKKYDVVISDGTKQRQEIGMMANNIKELQGFVAMSDEKIVQVLREYEDEECKNYGKFDPQAILNGMNTPMAQGTGAAGKGYMHMDTNSEDFKKQIDALSHVKHDEDPTNIRIEKFKNVSDIVLGKPDVEPVIIHEVNNLRPRYFNIGSVECKIENGKVYQKQWMRLTDDEMKELRIVSDKNNKIMPLKDKHIEMMKWVMTEENKENE